MKIQHLVLDEDVHKALKARKKKSGTTVREFGNAALRAALAIPTKRDLVVQNLVEAGKITREDYDNATRQADKEIRQAQQRVHDVIAHDQHRLTWSIGSWEGTELYRSPDQVIQIGELRVRRGRRVATPTLVFDEQQFWAIVLSGKVAARTDGEDHVLEESDVLHIKAGIPHSTTPLTQNARILLVANPAIDLDGLKAVARDASSRSKRTG